MKKILTLIIGISIVCAVMLSATRLQIESGYKNYQMVLDYNEIIKMSEESGEDVEYFLGKFHDMNVNYVALNEATLQSLSLKDDIELDYEVVKNDIYIRADKDTMEFIKAGFERKLGPERVSLLDGVLVIDGQKKDFVFDETPVRDFEGNIIGNRKIAQGSKLEGLGLGYFEADYKTIASSGMVPIPRPIFMSEYEDESAIDYYFEYMDSKDIKPEFILFAGKELLGYEDGIDRLADEMRKRDIGAAMVENVQQREHIEQKGMEELVEKLDYKAVRAFSLWSYIQKRYDYEIPLHRNGQEVMNALYRAITERNIRVVYFRPFIDQENKYVTDMDIYKQRFEELDARLERVHGIKVGKIQFMRYNQPSRFMMIPIAFGIIAFAVFLLGLILNIKQKYLNIIAGLGFLGTAGLYVMNIKVDLLSKMFALLGSIVMPSLAIYYVLTSIMNMRRLNAEKKLSQILMDAVRLLFIAASISAIGVVYEVSLLSSSKFFLEMDIFKGVKLSQVAPIAMAIVSYFALVGYKRKEEAKTISLNEIKELMDLNIKLGYVVIMGIIGVVGLIYIARMGHETNIKPSSFELLFRNMLEIILPARPRTKSLLFANPILIFMVYMAYKKYKGFILPCMLVFAIGQGNIVNTFSHLRTPLYLSIIRTSTELVLGSMIGVLLVVLLDFIVNRLKKEKEKRVANV